MDRLILEDMIWPEVAEVLPEIKVALIPVGSCEQHGPNTTFVTDTVRAYRIAKLLAGRCGHKVICFPPITYGISSHHMDFPCSATLRVSTLTAVLVDTALSAVHYGIDKVLFVNAHGGNKPCLMSAVQILKQEHDVTAFWTPVGSELLEGGIQKYFLAFSPATSAMHARWRRRNACICGRTSCGKREKRESTRPAFSPTELHSCRAAVRAFGTGSTM